MFVFLFAHPLTGVMKVADTLKVSATCEFNRKDKKRFGEREKIFTLDGQRQTVDGI
ncbi:MAG: hypothetical protein ACJAYJ_001584 [Saprospiraceae bacterium]